MAGTTIDGLNAVTSLTAQDEVPVWDAEASGEPTKKITAQNMTASVKTLGSLVNTSEMNTALAGKQNTLTFDTTPTTGSTNPVTSGGIADAIAQSTAKSTSTANVTIYTGNITAYVNKLLKCAGLVYAFLEVETTSGQALTISDAFARIPSGWRPKVAEEFPASILQSNDIWATYKVSIGTNGDIKQLLTNTAKGVSFVAVYEHE